MDALEKAHYKLAATPSKLGQPKLKQDKLRNSEGTHRDYFAVAPQSRLFFCRQGHLIEQFHASLRDTPHTRVGWVCRRLLAASHHGRAKRIGFARPAASSAVTTKLVELGYLQVGARHGATAVKGLLTA